MALRWGDVDLRTAKLMVRRSRTLGEDNAPKTAASERTIDLARTVVDVLRGVKPLHVTDEDFVFRNTEGRPIFADNFGKYWHPALRAVGVRPRKFYATRHTFISVALTRGVRIKWLAEYVGLGPYRLKEWVRGSHLVQQAKWLVRKPGISLAKHSRRCGEPGSHRLVEIIQ